MPLEATAPLFN